ncbi:2OG-Fe(II) oxygenase [Sphingomonas sp. Root50]|nr:2OG-Fe(II) oxygenase [Sphingomonas sp. Root1294]KQY72033.1 2OG-Fe(II) oxygenase [Sphingomonas sp. Root50]KRB94698.1 2OG-Fe(II) oxygenase [Sphingomonas sp. Root720]
MPHPVTAACDLFELPLLPGFDLRPDLLDAAEERALIARIDEARPSPFRFQQWTGKRLTRSYGWSHDFETGRFAMTDPLPDWLMPLRERAAGFGGLDPEVLVQALVIRYDPGAGIGWHRDRPVFGQVIGISLGAPAALRFRRRRAGRFARIAAPLSPRSIYHLDGEARNDWEHSIAPIEQTRWSISFRSLAEIAA